MNVLPGILACLLLSGSALAAEPARPAAPAKLAAPVKAAVLPVAADPALAQVRVLIAASREAKLATLMEGRLLALPKSAGDSFNRGDVLAEFDCSNQRADLAMAAARLEKATRTFESQQSLSKLNAVSDLDLALARADVAEGKARHQQAEANVSRCTISAPYAGRVVRRVANQFEILAPGAPVLEIVETGALRLELLLPSRWLGWLKNGTAFTVHIDEINRDVPAKVTSLGSRVDPVSQTVSVQAVLTQATPGILPGMSGSAIFTAGKR